VILAPRSGHPASALADSLPLGSWRHHHHFLLSSTYGRDNLHLLLSTPPYDSRLDEHYTGGTYKHFAAGFGDNDCGENCSGRHYNCLASHHQCPASSQISSSTLGLHRPLSACESRCSCRYQLGKSWKIAFQTAAAAATATSVRSSQASTATSVTLTFCRRRRLVISTPLATVSRIHRHLRRLRFDLATFCRL
jgi:hypothetical protein